MKLPKGIYEVRQGLYRWEFCYDGIRYTGTNHDAKQAVTDRENKKYEVRNGKASKEKNYSTNAWFEIWIDEYKTNLKDGTKATYRQVYNDYIKTRFGNVKIKDIKADKIQQLINDMFRNGFSYGRVNMVYTIFHQMLSKAKALKYINYNPMVDDAVEMPAQKLFKKTDKVKSLTDTQLNTFFEYAKDSVYLDAYRFMATTGTRIGECSGLSWSDVDWTNDLIHINNTLTYIRHSGRQLDSAKTDNSIRTIPMTAEMKLMLMEVRNKQNRNRLMLGDKWKTEKGFENMVFQYPTGGALWQDSAQRDINKIVKKINDANIEFPHITSHIFRHTFATLWVKRGQDTKVLQKILGHSTYSMTMDKYVVPTMDSYREEMELVKAI